MNKQDELHDSLCVVRFLDRKTQEPLRLEKCSSGFFRAILLKFAVFVSKCFAREPHSVLGERVFDVQRNVIHWEEVTVTSDDSEIVYQAKTDDAGTVRAIRARFIWKTKSIFNFDPEY